MSEQSLEETVKRLQAKVDELERRAGPPRASRRAKRLVVGLGLGVLVTAGLALAQPVPNVFAPDAPARADEVNTNFADLVTRLGALTTRVATLETTNVPPGTIAFFDVATCPSGWSAYGAARGRTIVGLPVGGMVGGTQGGAALTNLENRTHGHQWARWDGPNLDWYSFTSTGTEEVITNWSDGMDSAGSGGYPLEASNATSRSHFTDRQGSVMPYVQLLACRKN
ncbi:MAG: hypothetical protein Q8N26_36375 [Myxococcales bacterium]|nr:hypothetical protein [Myxococcales bacterium]